MFLIKHRNINKLRFPSIKTGYTLADRRLQDMLIHAYLDIKNMFSVRTHIKNLREWNKLVLPHVKTTCYGLKSVIYKATRTWTLFYMSIEPRSR